MLGLDHPCNSGTRLVKNPCQHGCGLVDDSEQGGKEDFPGRQIGKGLNLRFVEKSAIQDTALYLGLLKFFLEVRSCWLKEGDTQTHTAASGRGGAGEKSRLSFPISHTQTVRGRRAPESKASSHVRLQDRFKTSVHKIDRHR